VLAAFAQEKQGVSTFPDAAIIRASESSQAPQSSHVSAPVISLTRREQEVLRLLAKGTSNQDIAQALVISLETVKKHVSNLLDKLAVSSRTQAVAQARARSLL
jgi:LuxR family maltose regulon positive regulatory protein